MTSPTVRATQANLGTFAGVFTPSILTILGIILCLRLGYLVVSAGLGRAEDYRQRDTRSGGQPFCGCLGRIPAFQA